MKYWLTVSFLLVIFSGMIYYVNAEEEPFIEITISGEPVIDLSSTNRMIRADVQVTNFSPTNGFYIMQIKQQSTQKIISEKEVLVKGLSSGDWGVHVGYIVDEYDIEKNGGTAIGDYEILIKTEFADAVANTQFSVIKSTQSNEQNEIIALSEPELITSKQIEKIESDSTSNEKTDLPQWIRNIFIWYGEGKISETELLDAIKILIQDGIIKV